MSLFKKDDPQKAQEFKSKALELFYDKNFKEALTLFSKSITYNKNDDEVLSLIGRCNLYLKDYEKAILSYNSALLIVEKSDYYCFRSIAFKEIGNLVEALNDANMAIELDPNLLVSYRLRAGIFSSLNKHYDAIKDWDKVIELDPTDFDAHSFRGYQKAFLGGNLDAALEDINKAIAADSSKSVYFFHRGFTYILMGNFVKAKIDMTIASELGDKDALNVLRDFECRIKEVEQKKRDDEMVEELKK